MIKKVVKRWSSSFYNLSTEDRVSPRELYSNYRLCGLILSPDRWSRERYFIVLFSILSVKCSIG